MRRLYLLLLLATFATMLYGKMSVMTPLELKKKLPNKISFVMGNYGKYPFGSTVTGTLILADPIEACTTIKSLWEGKEYHNIEFPIFVIERGNCKFAFKTMNAQRAGARMVIFVDNIDEYSPRQFGGGDEPDIHIPSILIPKTEGDIIINHLQQFSDPSIHPVQITVQFPHVSDKAVVEFWFSSSDPTNTAYKFLEDFTPYLENFGEDIEFRPMFPTWTCSKCALNGFSSPNPDCVSSGRYCSPDPDNSGPLTGRDVVLENLRQLCLLRKFPEYWIKYAIQFWKNCLNKQHQVDCSLETMKEIGLSEDQIQDVKFSMNVSFGVTNMRFDQEQDNHILKDQLQIQLERDIMVFPAIVINGKVHKGRIHPDVVAKEICASFKNPPQFCLTRSSIGKGSVGAIVILVVILMIVMVALLIYNRRQTKKEMETEMTIQISQMIAHYYALNESDSLVKKEEKV